MGIFYYTRDKQIRIGKMRIWTWIKKYNIWYDNIKEPLRIWTAIGIISPGIILANSTNITPFMLGVTWLMILTICRLTYLHTITNKEQ